MLSHDTAGSTLAPTKRKNLPNRILRAFDAAKHLQGLPRGVKDTFAELCRFVPQAEPFATIFAHKSKIALRIGASERTVYRHLNYLKETGLIEILPQERKSRNGRYAVARIVLTQKAAEMVGLVESSSELIHSIPYDNLSSGHTLTEPTISKSQLPKCQNGVPEELAWLMTNGVSRAGVFSLMGMATAKGKRLSDIALAVHDYVKDLKGGRLYAYLAKLAKGPTDFAIAAANERLRKAEEQKQAVFANKCRIFKERFRSTALTDRSQNRLYLIDDHARFVQILGNDIRATHPLNDLGPWIEAVQSGRLVLATLAQERKFCQFS